MRVSTKLLLLFAVAILLIVIAPFGVSAGQRGVGDDAGRQPRTTRVAARPTKGDGTSRPPVASTPTAYRSGIGTPLPTATKAKPEGVGKPTLIPSATATAVEPAPPVMTTQQPTFPAVATAHRTLTAVATVHSSLPTATPTAPTPTRSDPKPTLQVTAQRPPVVATQVQTPSGLPSPTYGPKVAIPEGGLINPDPLPSRTVTQGNDGDRGGQNPQGYNSQEVQLLIQTNAARRAYGVPPLKENDNLAAAAHWLAADMATRNYFNHTDSLGRTFDRRLADFNYWHNAGGIAENIAAAYAGPPEVIAAWLNSSGHAQNMLNPTYREMGVGYGENAGSQYGTYFVQDFGFTPDVYPIIINDEQPQSNSSRVHLYIYGSGWANEMMLSNDPNYSGAIWQPFAAEMDWDLLPGGGTRAVFVTIRNSSGQTRAAADTIYVLNPPTTVPTNTPLPTSTPTPCPGQLFPDVACNYWAYTAIQSLAVQGIVSGKSDGLFHPTDSVNRAELARMIVAGNGWPINTSGGPHFSDVPTSYWAYAAIETARSYGAMSGYPNATFRPGATVSRDQLGVIMVKARGYGAYYPPAPSFNDVGSNNWAYGFIEQARRLGIISGYPDGTFRPGAIVNRDAQSVILYRAMQVPPATPTP